VDPKSPPRLKRSVGRRRLLLGAAATAGFAALDAFALEPSWLDIVEHDVLVPKLPRSLDGFTVAQVTDAHLADLGRVELEAVKAVRRLQVGLVVMTGDIVDHPAGIAVLAELGSALRESGAEVLATLGNWEHWAGFVPEGLAAEYRRFGARLLMNEAVSVAGLTIASTDDGYAGAPRWDQTLSNLGALDKGAPKILLTHSPAMFDLAPVEAPRFDLSLAGHTHGGQLRLGPLSPLVPPGSGRFVAGFYDTRLGRAYVSRGTGTSIVPARFLCRPELPVFRLRVA
jgi:predicted MPP superfamily phosphohydrolase